MFAQRAPDLNLGREAAARVRPGCGGRRRRSRQRRVRSVALSALRAAALILYVSNGRDLALATECDKECGGDERYGEALDRRRVASVAKRRSRGERESG